MAAMRFGLMTLQSAPYAALADRWRRTEAMGFDSVWIADHSSSQYPNLVSYEAWALLGALATVTTRVRFGALVTPPTFRHPAMVAMSAVTVDHISNGRLEIGLGAGGGAPDAGFVGEDGLEAGGLVDRLAEYIEILDRMLRGETVTFEGKRYRAAGAVVVPSLQRPRPPFVIAAQGPRGLRLVAKYADTWNTLGGQPMRSASPKPATLDQAIAATRAQLGQLDAACRAAGRDPSTVRRSLLAYRVQLFESVDRFEDYVGRYAELGFDECIFYWPSDPTTFAPRQDLEKTMERIAADVLPRLSAGGRAI
jgi:alkanesulfonate monooxygenase SsuD/methylene tetrahydromethanopterin reductase-like flavin-dependent oxidoreductase (luciferase family)